MAEPKVLTEEALKMAREIVACAAIRLKNGAIFAGHRHHDCLGKIHACGLSKMEIDEQGFMTTKGRFVGRTMAFSIQCEADIRSADQGGYRGTELYSEDLY